MKFTHILFVDLIWCFLVSFHATVVYSASINVSLGFIAPLDTELGPLKILGEELESAFKLAIENVNKKSPNVRLRTEFIGTVKDEGKNPSESCKKAAEAFHKDDKIVGIVGGYSSQCAVAIQNELKLKNSKLPQISYRSPSVKLLQKDLYPNFYRTSSNNKKEAQVIVDIIKHFRWNQASIIHTDDEYYGNELSDEIVSRSKNSGIYIKERKSFSSDESRIKIVEKLQQIKASGSRINIIVAQGNDFFKIVKQIKAERMYGEGWVWIATDGGASLYLGSDSDVNITAAGFVGIVPEMFSGRSFFDLVIAWYGYDKETHPGAIWRSETDPAISPFVGQVFRAVSAYSSVLNQLFDEKKLTTKNTGYEIRAMVNQRLTSLKDIRHSVKSILGGPIYFDDETEEAPRFGITNYFRGKFKRVGSWDENASPRITLPAGKIVWPGGGSQTPTDRGKELFRIGFVSPTSPALGTGGDTMPVEKVIYRIAAFLPKHSGLGALADLGKSWETALRAAVNWVNRNETLTVGFNVSVYDTGLNANECSELSKNLPGFIDFVIGAARSECTAAIYQQIKNRGIPMLSYASTSTVFSEKTNYPNLFRMSPSDEHQANALADLTGKYLWKILGIVSARGIYGQELTADIMQHLSNQNISVTTTELFHEGSKRMIKQISKLKESGSGVNIMISNPHDSFQLYQEAFELNMVGKGWTWLGSDGVISTMFKRSQNLQRAMQGMVGFRPQTGSGHLFESIYDEWLRIDHSADRTIAYIAQIFDSVVLPAVTLHSLHKENVISSSISKIDARGHLLRRLKSLQSPEDSFESTTGKEVYFDVHQDVNGAYDLVNLNGNRWVQVGKYEAGQLNITRSVIWPGGTVKFPSSNSPYVHRLDKENLHRNF